MQANNKIMENQTEKQKNMKWKQGLRVPFGVMLGLYWGNIGVMEKKRETTTMGYIGTTKIEVMKG